MSLPGVEPVLPSWKVGVVTASRPSRTISQIHKHFYQQLDLLGDF